MILPRLGPKQGQVTPFLILVIAVLILAIVATMLIGEVSFNRIRMSNVADGALISVASALCRSLNQIRQISLGPGGLQIHWLALQVFLLAHRTRCCKATLRGWRYKGEPLATGFFINSMLQSKELYKQAERIAKEAKKDLRISLYDRSFGGALIDEPKPFLDSEVKRDRQGRIISLDYDSYINRDARLVLNLREFKSEYPEGDDAWFKNNLLSYSYNKTKDRVLEDLNPDGTPRVNTVRSGEPLANYEAYLRVALQDVPEEIEVQPQAVPMYYVVWEEIPDPCECVPHPKILVHPYAWIRRIDMDSTSFGLFIRKLSSFIRLPFFGRSVELEHSNRIRIKGNVRSSGYDFRMEE